MRVRHFGNPPENRNDWQTIKALLPYLWEFRGRVLLAMSIRMVTPMAVMVAWPAFSTDSEV